jgi:hypothetical protein
MPKAKKLRAPALESQQVRHEPLGQAIEGDQLRGKYAAPSRGRRKQQQQQDGSGGSTPSLTKRLGEDAEYLDDKASKRILDMSREQQIEEEMEEHRTWQERTKGGKHDQTRRQVGANKNKNIVDDSDEEDDIEVEEIIVDDDEE